MIEETSMNRIAGRFQLPSHVRCGGLGGFLVLMLSLTLLADPVSNTDRGGARSLHDKAVSNRPDFSSRTFMHAVARPRMAVTITASRTGETVREVVVEEGQRVQKGDLLLRFDDRLTKARLGIAQAEYQRAISAVKATRLEYELAYSRYLNIVDAWRQGAATRVELSEAKVRWQQERAQHEAAVDTVRKAEESRKFAEVECAMTRHVAPFDGTVVRTFAVPGQSPGADDPLVELVDSSTLRVDLYLPIERYRELRERETWDLMGEAPVNEKLTGTRLVFDDVIDAATQTVRCVLEIDNRDARLPGGFRVRLLDE